MPRDSSIKMKATSARPTPIRSSIQRTDSPSVMLGQIANKPDESGLASDVADVGQTPTPIVNPISTVRSEVNDGHKEVLDISEQKSGSSNDFYKTANNILGVYAGWDRPENNSPVRKEVVGIGLDASLETSVVDESGEEMPVTCEVTRDDERTKKRARDELESGGENLIEDVSVPEIVDEAAGDVEGDQPGGGQVAGCDPSCEDTCDSSSDDHGVLGENWDMIIMTAKPAVLPSAMFDLDATLRAALKKYKNGKGVVTRANRSAFTLDLKKVAVVTFFRGFDVEKALTCWTDPVQLDKFKCICTKLGIRKNESVAPAKDELTLFRASLIVPYAHPRFCISGDDQPGAIQIHKLPKASHCLTFCSVVPNTDDWLGVFYAGICYLIYRDNTINMMSGKHQKVSQIVAFADGTRTTTTTASSSSNEENIARMRNLGITEEIRISFLALPNSFQKIMKSNANHAIKMVNMILAPMKDIW